MKLNSTENEWLSETIKASARQGEGLEACEFPFKMLKELLANKVREREDWTGIWLYVDRKVVCRRHEVPQVGGQLARIKLKDKQTTSRLLQGTDVEKNCANPFLITET